MEPRYPTPLDDFLFDLNGYLILRNAAEPDLLDALNEAFDNFPSLQVGEWWGNTQRRDYTGETGFELHNCVEAGEPFERLIDHPGWINYVRRYAGEQDSYVAGLFIDECIASIRRSGGHHPVHSGGYRGALRGRYEYTNGVFRCGQANIILALGDVGPEDGPTMVIPGSHKSNFPHPNAGDYAARRSDGPPGGRHPGAPQQGRRFAVRGWPDARRLQPHQHPRRAARHHLSLRPEMGNNALRLRILCGLARPPDSRKARNPAASSAAAPAQPLTRQSGQVPFRKRIRPAAG